MERLMGEQKCRSWEEEMYWKHFNSMHFCHILHDDFHDRLVLPQKFAENMITKLPDKVSLFGPSGVMWDVTLTKTNNVAFVGDEWKEFVKAYALKANYLLIFKYMRNVGFKVLILDPVSLCEKETTYFVTKHGKRTSSMNNQEKERSSAEDFCTQLIEDDENDDDDSDFLISKRVRKDTEDPAWVGETINMRTPRKCSTGRVKRVGTPKRNKAGEEQPVVENGESDVELGRSHDSSEIKAKKQIGNEGAQKHISSESGEGNLEIVQSSKPNEISGKKANGNELAKQLRNPEKGGRTLKNVHSLKCYETRGNPKNQIYTKSSRETEFERDNALVAPLVLVLLRKKSKRSGAAKEQHGTNLETVHSPKYIEVIGNTPNESEVSKEQNSPEVGGRMPEIHACKSSGARGRPRKQNAPTSKNSVHENVLLGNKSNMNDAAKEQNGLDTGASNLGMLCFDKSSKTRGRPRRQITNSQSKLKLESDSSKGRFFKEYVSKRRPVTEKEKENALQRAQQGLTDKSFIVVMRPTTIYKKFYLHIPSDWTHKFLPRQNHEVLLRVGDKTWSALFYYYIEKGTWLSGAGLKKFVLDNRLEEFDVCLVKLASEKGDEATVLDVDIFRVIPEIVSPSPVVLF